MNKLVLSYIKPAGKEIKEHSWNQSGVERQKYDEISENQSLLFEQIASKLKANFISFLPWTVWQ